MTAARRKPGAAALADLIADALAPLGPDKACKALEAMLDDLEVIELAALAYDWEHTWARPVQLVPDGGWVSHGFLTGRRFGKTRANAEFVHREAMSGRAMRIGFCAQNFDKTIEVMVHGDAGLMATAPPWARPKFVGEKGIPARVVWPNGAQAFPFTPEEPGKIRGPGTHLFWASELQSWPASKREEALLGGILPMTSLGYGKLIWDATPKRRHPVIRMLLKRAVESPDLHTVVTGAIRDNVDNLSEAAIADLERTIGGTQRGREELLGIFSDEDEGALWSQDWIDRARRGTPSELKRRVIGIDPAISDRKGTDETGMIEVGLGVDDQVHVLGDHTKTYAWPKWGELAVKRYLRTRCDCIVVERNRGGDACRNNIIVAARARGVRAELVKKDAPTRHVPGVVYVKEVTSRGSKAARFEAIAGLYELGRVSHCSDVDLEDLEDLMTTWEPEVGGDSPDALDALGMAVEEVADFDAGVDHREGFKGADKVADAIRTAAERDKRRRPAPGAITTALGRSTWGSKI